MGDHDARISLKEGAKAGANPVIDGSGDS